MPRNVFDQAARFCVQSDPIGFFLWLIRHLAAALLFQGWLDTRTLPFPGAPDRTCDLVAELAENAEADRRWAIVTEFQTDPDTEILDRELEYVALIRRGLRFGPQRRGKYQVVAALVNLTGPSQTDTLEMGLFGLDIPNLGHAASTVRRPGRQLDPPRRGRRRHPRSDRRRSNLALSALLDFADARRRRSGYH